MVVKINILYRFEGFEMDPINRVLKVAGQPISLHAKTFDLLRYMVRNAGRLLTKDELMNAVWGDTAVEEGNLTQGVFLLRKALATSRPEGGKLIVTVPGRGYRFDVLVEEVPADAAFAPAREEPAAMDPTQIRNPSRRRYILIATGALVPLLAIAGWLWRVRAVPGDHHEIVLADFENTTGDSEFDKALNIALSIDLKQSPYLLVAPDAKARKTLELMERSAQEKLTTPLAREVCQRIGAQAVLSAVIARFGQKYLVTLTASDCVSGQDLVQTKAVAAGRDNILEAIDSVAAQMRGRLGEPLRSLHRFDKPLLAKATGSLDALKGYSAAHELAGKGRFQESVPLFLRAIELDPRFSIAYGDLATAYNNLGEPDLSAAASRKAYEMRDFADERDRLYIAAAYHTYTVGDLHATIRDYETWMEMYPRDIAPLCPICGPRSDNRSSPSSQPGAPWRSTAKTQSAISCWPAPSCMPVTWTRRSRPAGRRSRSRWTARKFTASSSTRVSPTTIAL